MGGLGWFRTWVSAFVPVGGDPVPFFGTQCSFLRYTGLLCLAKFEYQPTQLFVAVRTALLLQHMVGGLVGGWVAWSVGGCVVRYVDGCVRACGRWPS